MTSWKNSGEIMDVKITDYGEDEDAYFVCYDVFYLSSDQMSYLNDNLGEETKIEDGIFKIKMNFDEKMYPFQSDVAKIRLDDFIVREEIEMNIFLSGFLQDM